MNNTTTSDAAPADTVTVTATETVNKTPARKTAAAKPTLDMNSAKRGLLLRMSHTRFEQGELRQAVEGYLSLIEEYPNSDESKAAQAQLLAIAQRYEQEGTLRLSLDVFERLEQVLATD